jgi:predicted membrane-bound dolichyl-phosphate-mannose-protein mannosyltransferase
MLIDPVFRNMTIVALLDTYVAGFTAVGVYYFIKAVKQTDKIKKIMTRKTYRRLWMLAGLSKMNGIFIFPVL